MKSASELPFLQEKLDFRKRVIAPPDSNILCAYAGRESRLTQYYVSLTQNVIAVDKKPDFSIRAHWIKGSIPESLPMSGDFYIVDFDPDGSPMPALTEWLSSFRGHFTWLIITDGCLTTARFRRRLNLQQYYGVLPDRVDKLPAWCWRNFECLVFFRIVSLINRPLLDVIFQRNRYQMGLYAAFEFDA